MHSAIALRTQGTFLFAFLKDNFPGRALESKGGMFSYRLSHVTVRGPESFELHVCESLGAGRKEGGFQAWLFLGMGWWSVTSGFEWVDSFTPDLSQAFPHGPSIQPHDEGAMGLFGEEGELLLGQIYHAPDSRHQTPVGQTWTCTGGRDIRASVLLQHSVSLPSMSFHILEYWQHIVPVQIVLCVKTTGYDCTVTNMGEICTTFLGPRFLLWSLWY